MSSFHERQKNLFNHLKDAEDQHGFSKTNKAAPPEFNSEIDKQTYRKLKHEMKQFRGKESIYKKKEANIRECFRAKSVPDYIKNPKKWVYYTLSDVTPEQMSDATNTATALALIQKLEEDSKSNMECSEDNTDVVFKKPTFHSSSTVKKALITEDKKPTFKGNKVIMPEYIVGVTRKKEKKNKITRRSSQDTVDVEKKAELKLNHLFEDDEES